jgi:hypothetical protein
MDFSLSKVLERTKPEGAEKYGTCGWFVWPDGLS